ncbi:hypothetical protein SLA2020_181460 [Shorea laevis]
MSLKNHFPTEKQRNSISTKDQNQEERNHLAKGLWLPKPSKNSNNLVKDELEFSVTAHSEDIVGLEPYVYQSELNSLELVLASIAKQKASPFPNNITSISMSIPQC